MNFIRRTLFVTAALLLAVPVLHAQASESAIHKQIKELRSLSAQQRPIAMLRIAADIRALPASPKKVGLADALAHLVTEGDQGADALQSVADALSQALAQTPIPAKKDKIPAPYIDLAQLVRYKHVKVTKVTADDPLFTKAAQELIANDADVEKADFTLKDLNGKKFTLSELRGKIVLINFWNIESASSSKELVDLDLIYTHFESQGLVILSITDDDVLKVGSTISSMGYHPPVLLDSSSKVRKAFHVDSYPRSFVFNREGKLVDEAINQCTQQQVFSMLAKAGLHP
jgi:peroxiredoxin